MDRSVSSMEYRVGIVEELVGTKRCRTNLDEQVGGGHSGNEGFGICTGRVTVGRELVMGENTVINQVLGTASSRVVITDVELEFAGAVDVAEVHA